ncbi:MAG: serine/threonine protein kinase [Deltaproteobacteria bacterium]|nr:serine/threonine protein kinase [Deltaproteobacteria bacterium]
MAPGPIAARPTDASELELTRRGLLRALAIGTPAFLAFLPLDLWVRASLHPETSVLYCVTARVGGALSLAFAWLVLRRPGWTELQLLLITSFILSLGLVGLALIAVGLGGLDSGYTYAPAFYAVGAGTFLPSHWRRSVLIILPPTVTFFGTFLVGITTSPTLARELDDPELVVVFVQNAILVTGIIAFAVLSGHVLWRARNSLADARRLGRYLLRSPLGQGGMNEVWLAWDGTLKREVALKLLHTRHPDDARRKRFEREAHATSKLTSPHTVRIYDFGASDDGTAWIAMEYLKGRDLDGLVAAVGPMDPRRVVHFGRQAAQSLAEAHAHGIVHRDIKPANLLALSGGGQADFLKVLDFGIARRLDADDAALTMVGMVVGTPIFMAPEVLAGAPADPRSDVWSFGATLYTLLTGVLPREPAELVAARKSVTPPSRRSGAALPPALEALVMRCMAPSPADRPANGAALVAELAEVDVGAWTEADADAWWAARAAATTAP